MSEFIKKWQSENGLLADGVIGKKTLLKIKEVLNIPTIEATANFIGNTFHETGGFIRFEENLNYSEQGLLKIFPKYFKILGRVKECARNPQKIANVVYANRMGNDGFNDGWKFRGRGALQTTGKNNYTLLGNYLGVDLISNPDLVTEKYAFESAIFYFNNGNVWKYCNSVDKASITKVRKLVNGGSIGLEDVIVQVNKFYNMMK